MGVTQRQLAVILQISPSTIALYETGERRPDPEMLSKLADSLKVSTDFLLGRDIEIESDNWMDKLSPETRTHLESVGGMRGFHGRFLKGKGLSDLSPEMLEMIVESYFEHLERDKAEAEKKKQT